MTKEEKVQRLKGKLIERAQTRMKENGFITTELDAQLFYVVEAVAEELVEIDERRSCKTPQTPGPYSGT